MTRRPAASSAAAWAPAEGAVITATFHPQEWVGPRADRAEPAGEPRTYDVTEAVLELGLRDLLRIEDYQDSSDRLLSYAEHGHDGPFEVVVTESICAFFGVDAMRDISPARHAAARQARGIGQPRVFEVDLARTATRHATVEVTATSARDARNKAYAMAGDVDFSAEKDADYEVMGAREQKPGRAPRP